MFDDCQDVVKRDLLGPRVQAGACARRRQLDQLGTGRGAGRLLFQGLLCRDASNDEQVSFAVPSGNFGNIFAGYVAKRMGLPIRRLSRDQRERCARRVLSHRPLSPAQAAETHATSSPSMDISKASNFERFIWDMVDGDGASRGCGAPGDEEGGFILATRRRASARLRVSARAAARTRIACAPCVTSNGTTACSSIRTRPTASR